MNKYLPFLFLCIIAISTKIWSMNFDYSPSGYTKTQTFLLQENDIEKIKSFLISTSISDLNALTGFNHIKGKNFQDSLIHLLVRAQKWDIITLSIQAGAKHNLRNSYNNSPAGLAYHLGDDHLLEFSIAIEKGFDAPNKILFLNQQESSLNAQAKEFKPKSERDDSSFTVSSSNATHTSPPSYAVATGQL